MTGEGEDMDLDDDGDEGFESEDRSKPLTEDEARDAVIRAARFSAWWWTTQVEEAMPAAQRVTGALFTFLAELDGCGEAPACDIMVGSHDEDGNLVTETRVSTMLHEFFYGDDWNPHRDGSTKFPP